MPEYKKCGKCDKQISKEEYDAYDGLCMDCYEEEQQLEEDDLD